ncbi:MAG TPA: phosphotransferase family protein [Ensifer sp.]|nr:phosphotransferase family protein [Ensifer sp.]
MDASRFIGTEPLPADHRIDLARLSRLLKERLPDCSGTLSIERFRGGQSNPTMLLSLDGKRRFVLRKKPDGELLPSAHAVDREFRVISALKDSDVPVATPRFLCDDASIVGAMFYVMDYVEGRSFWEPVLPELAPHERTAIYAEMNRVIGALHAIDHRAVGLEDFGKPENYVARQVARWTRQYRASETETIASMDFLIDWLPDNIPQQRGASLIHGDYRIDNMIFHPTEPRVLAVVDWELSTLGDPMADFAYHMLTWHFPSKPYRGLARQPLEQLGIPSERRYRDHYLAATGRADVSDRDWFTYLAFCLFRVTGIRQGIMKRVLDGNAANPHAREAGALARSVADMGFAYAERAMKA